MERMSICIGDYKESKIKMEKRITDVGRKSTVVLAIN